MIKNRNLPVISVIAILFLFTAMAVFVGCSDSAGTSNNATPIPTDGDVKAINPLTGEIIQHFYPYDEGFTGDIFVATGDINADGKDEIITSTGVGYEPRVKYYNGMDATLIGSYLAEDPSLLNGLSIDTGDFNGDGKDEIITGYAPDSVAQAGGNPPHVKVYDTQTNTFIKDFIPFTDGTIGGLEVSAGDINGDTIADTVVGAGPGGLPLVRVFDGNTDAQIISFQAYDAALTGGVRVSVGDVNGDGVLDIITGAGPGSIGPLVKVFSGVDWAVLASFYAYDQTYQGGVEVSDGYISSYTPSDIIIGIGTHTVDIPQVKIFNGRDFSLFTSFNAFEALFTGGVTVAPGDIEGDGDIEVVTGKARL